MPVRFTLRWASQAQQPGRGESTTFTVTLNTDEVWSGSEQIAILSNDADNGDGVENPFTFVVSGRVTAMPPEIAVFDGTTSILSGQTTPIDLGSAARGAAGPAGTSPSRTTAIKSCS